MNHITYWASLINENINNKLSDEPSYQDAIAIGMDMTPEEYNALSDEEKEDIHFSAEHPAVDEPDLDRMSDKEKDAMMKRSEEFLDKSDASSMPQYRIFVCESVYVPSNDRRNRAVLQKGISGRDDLMRIKVGDLRIDNRESLPPCATKTEARRVVAKRMKEMCNEYGVTFRDFEVIDSASIPSIIRDADPDAIGFICTKAEGEGKRYETRGVQKTGDTSKYDFSFDKVTMTRFFEYIIYRSSSELKFDEKANMLKAISSVMRK